MEIKPIRSEADYQTALKEIEILIESQPGTPEGDRMDVLVTLVEAYEAKHFPIPEPDDPVEVLEYYMESRGLSRSDLIAYLGSKERVSEVLNRKRGLSLQMIQRLHAGLGIPADLLIAKQGHKATSIVKSRTKSQVRV
ncbi:MAG: helix-turn-helix domain-containing protein [Bellilinea sp.]